MMTRAAPARAAVATTGLTRRFGQRTAVDGIDIRVPYGVIAGSAVASGGTSTVGYSRALLAGLLYVAAALAGAAVLFRRRDVTS